MLQFVTDRGEDLCGVLGVAGRVTPQSGDEQVEAVANIQQFMQEEWGGAGGVIHQGTPCRQVLHAAVNGAAGLGGGNEPDTVPATRRCPTRPAIEQAR